MENLKKDLARSWKEDNNGEFKPDRDLLGKVVKKSDLRTLRQYLISTGGIDPSNCMTQIDAQNAILDSFAQTAILNDLKKEHLLEEPQEIRSRENQRRKQASKKTNEESFNPLTSVLTDAALTFFFAGLAPSRPILAAAGLGVVIGRKL